MKFTSPNTQQGFTLIELMIVVAIIGILASIAVPSYQTYVKKAKFSEVVMATSTAKTGVELCFQTLAALTECDDSKNGINTVGASGYLLSISTTDGVITATAASTNGLNGETYIMTPTINTGKVTWINSGTCFTAGLC
ncbi:MAG: prepilin-type N-terminal cleavage/methylation domain-containing protein [Methylococcales bacterium]